MDVEENYRRARADLERDFTARRGTATDERGRSRTFEQAEPHYRTGFAAASDPRHADRRFEEVEPELRGQYESTAGERTGTDSWEHLREEVRAGWNRGRS